MTFEHRENFVGIVVKYYIYYLALFWTLVKMLLISNRKWKLMDMKCFLIGLDFCLLWNPFDSILVNIFISIQEKFRMHGCWTKSMKWDYLRAENRCNSRVLVKVNILSLMWWSFMDRNKIMHSYGWENEVIQI